MASSYQIQTRARAHQSAEEISYQIQTRAQARQLGEETSNQIQTRARQSAEETSHQIRTSTRQTSEGTSPYQIQTRARARQSTEEICAICLDKPRRPVTLRCKHVFCGSCVDRLKKEIGPCGNACPVCRRPITARRRYIFWSLDSQSRQSPHRPPMFPAVRLRAAYNQQYARASLARFINAMEEYTRCLRRFRRR